MKSVLPIRYIVTPQTIYSRSMICGRQDVARASLTQVIRMSTMISSPSRAANIKAVEFFSFSLVWVRGRESEREGERERERERETYV